MAQQQAAGEDGRRHHRGRRLLQVRAAGASLLAHPPSRSPTHARAPSQFGYNCTEINHQAKVDQNGVAGVLERFGIARGDAPIGKVAHSYMLKATYKGEHCFFIDLRRFFAISVGRLDQLLKLPGLPAAFDESFARSSLLSLSAGGWRFWRMCSADVAPGMTAWPCSSAQRSRSEAVETPCVAASWTSSPHSGGAWSFPRVGAPKDVAQALAAPLGRLSIAGEATSPQFFGTLHGAVESGQRAAAEVLG